MKPLIDIPRPAKLRIRKREAEASKYLELVRKESESRLRHPALQVSGTVIDTGDIGPERVDDAAVTAANHVFLAHATEYAARLRQPRRLALVLAKLREAVIKQYGEFARTPVRVRESQQIEKASVEQERASVLANNSRTVITGDARF
jgi:hypothetical protein